MLGRSVRVQETAFLSAGHYQRAVFDLVDAERRSEGYGAVISRLRFALSSCKTALEKAENGGVTVDLNDLADAISEQLAKIEKDNALVYLEVSFALVILHKGTV